MGNYSLSKGEGGEKGKFFCSVHYRQLFMSNPEAINYSRADAPKREQSKTDLTAEKEKNTPQMNGKSKQEIAKSTSVEDAEQRTEQVHISVEQVTEQSSKLPENEVQMLSGDETHEQNGDLPTDNYLEKEVFASEEEVVGDLQANEEGHGDLLEDEVGNANGDDLEEVTNTVNIKLDQAPRWGTPEKLASVSIEKSSTLDHQFESEKEPTTLALNSQVTSPSDEPEQPTHKMGITDENTHIPLHQIGDKSEKISKGTFTALETEILPQIEDELANITDITMEIPETSCTPNHQNGDKADSKIVDQEVAPEEGELTNKTGTIPKKHTSYTPNHQESITLDNETAHQIGEPKQPTCKIQTPTHQMRVMLSCDITVLFHMSIYIYNLKRNLHRAFCNL